MARGTPTSTRQKAAKAKKSPFVSPGTKKARQQTKDLIVTKAASDLMVMAGDNDKPLHGSMLKYSSATVKGVERLKKQEHEVLQSSGPQRSLLPPLLQSMRFVFQINPVPLNLQLLDLVPPGTVTETVIEQEEAGQRAQQKRRKNKSRKI
jgi:hypothetical protein